MNTLEKLFSNNRQWAENICSQQPDFFEQSAKGQSPKYLWLGCADSRVVPNQITQLAPGEIFVHRNIANVLVHSDLNCLSVLQYAVQVLQVEHVIVTGHYGCGGVAAALNMEEKGEEHGLVDNWLRHIGDVYQKYQESLQAIPNTEQRCRRLCELNVCQQVANVARTAIVGHAWQSGQKLQIHGWIYDLQNGLLRDLEVSVHS